jgi:hypothetical protein
LIWVFEVAAQPATASTAISIKIRFIAVLIEAPDLCARVCLHSLLLEAF